MKQLLLFLLALIPLTIRANDTLTMGRVYNVNIGDTFDYRISNWSQDEYPIYFERDIVVNRWLDTSAGLLYIVRYITTNQMHNNPHFDSLIIQYPEQFAIYSDSSLIIGGQVSYTIDSNSIFGGKILNKVYNQEFEGALETIYGEGLGKVLNVSYGGATNDPGNPFADSTLLIYFSKGTEKWGTPYYTADGENLIHFTPLPEECATWTSYLYNNTFQVSTRNKVSFNRHSYIELVYRSYNGYTQYFTPDTLIAYFRNDTVNQESLFYKTLSDSAFFIYNFKQIVNGDYCNAIDQVLVNGQLRTRWTYGYQTGNDSYYPVLTYIKYIEGIGGLNGLFPFFYPFGSSDDYNYTLEELNCLSVCGQMIYPSDTSALCASITGITPMTDTQIKITMFPTINNGQFEVDNLNGPECRLLIFDVLSKELFNRQLVSGINPIILNNTAAGIYYWKAVLGENVIQVGRFVIAKN